MTAAERALTAAVLRYLAASDDDCGHRVLVVPDGDPYPTLPRSANPVGQAGSLVSLRSAAAWLLENGTQL